MYIRATTNISPQNTFDQVAFSKIPVEYTGNRLQCIEPDYKALIDAKLIRRMSRIIRMGVAAAMDCLQQAAIEKPDAIVTGTAYGCMEDTALFLTKMVQFNEELLTPTAFIQSTHNTIGAQIGLLLQCNNYNNAFVHRGLSFESALLDGLLLLKEKEVSNVLVGAIDESTNTSHQILTRLGLYKKENINNLQLFTTQTKGTIAGEGAAFFLLANEPAATDYAALQGLKTFYKPLSLPEIELEINSFLAEYTTNLNEIDLIIVGKNGDKKADAIFDSLSTDYFKNKKLANFKHLCGEYPTASSFALWMAANIIKLQKMPDMLEYDSIAGNNIKRILIYNQYGSIYHSLMLVTAC